MKKIIFITLILIFGFFAVSALFYARPYAKYAREEKRLLLELEAEKEISLELEREKNYQGSNAFIEQIAREKLGFVHPDEIVFYNLAE